MNAADFRNLDSRIKALENVVNRLPVRAGASSGGAGGTSGSHASHYIAESKADLEARYPAATVPVGSVARIEGAGSDNGMFCIPNPGRTAWDALNFWE